MAKATYNPSRAGTGITLSSGNRIATWASSSDKFAQLQFYRATDEYWVEFELQAGSGVAFHTVGMGNASANVNSYVGADAHAKGVYETATRGTWAVDYNGGTTTIGTGLPQMGVASVMCLYVNCNTRKFFVYVHNGTTGAWIGDNPNTTPLGGFAWGFSGDGAPAYAKFHISGGALLRTAAQFTMAANAPAGAIMEWDDASAASGAMVGSASMSLNAAGTLAGAGAIAGTTSLSIAPSGQLRGNGAMSGGASLSLTTSATLAGAGALVGSAPLAITPTASLSGAGAMAGTAALSIGGSGALTGAANAAGSAALSLAASGELSAAGALQGTAPLQLTAAGDLSAIGDGQMSGSASMSLSANGALAGAGSMAGQTTVSLVPVATLTGSAGLAGNASISITASATGNLIGAMSGNALIAIAMVGELLGRAALAGNASLSITARATAYTDDAGRIPYIGIRPDSFEDGPANRPHDAIEPGQRPGAIAVVAER